VIIVATSVAIGRSSRFDERYYWEDNFPYHLTWHNAYIGLAENTDWKYVKPYPELSNLHHDDTNGYLVFKHYTDEAGVPFAAPSGFMRARPYEVFIRDQYFKFLSDHPDFAWDLFWEEKPFWFRVELTKIISSIARNPHYRAVAGVTAISLLISLFLFR